MRSYSKIALALATLTVVSACSEEPKAVAKKADPVVVQHTRPAVVNEVETRDDVTDGSVPDVVPPAVIAKQEERTLLEEEALFHDEMDAMFFLEGKRLMDEGKPGEAVTAFRKALFDTQDGETWGALGESYLAAGQRERGVACLEEALKKDPKLAVVREKLARAYLTKDPGKARAHAEVLARTRTNDVGSHYVLGRAYMKLSMWNEAIASFERALTLDPTSSYAHNNLGYSALQVGRTELAVQHLEAILDLSPQAPYMMNNLGIAYEKVGRGADAYAAYLRALELQPDYVNAVVNKDRLHASLSDAEKAVALDILDELALEPVLGATTAAAADDEHATP